MLLSSVRQGRRVWNRVEKVCPVGLNVLFTTAVPKDNKRSPLRHSRSPPPNEDNRTTASVAKYNTRRNSSDAQRNSEKPKMPSASGHSSGRESRRPATETFESTVDREAESMARAISPQLKTVFDVFRFAVSKFTQADLSYGQSTMTPWEDASFLVLHELFLPHEDPIRHWAQATLTEEEKVNILKLVHKRVRTRKPMAYLLKGCYQQGEFFHVDERVLIPRSFIGDILRDQALLKSTTSQGSVAVEKKEETLSLDMDYSDYFGEIVDEDKCRLRSENGQDSPLQPKQHSQSSSKTITQEKNANVYAFDCSKVQSVLDLCTGSGCLGILAYKFLPNIQHVDLVDLSPDAIDVAEANVEQKGLEEVIHLYQGDLFDALPLFYSGEEDIPVGNGEPTAAAAAADVVSHHTVSSAKPRYDLIISNPPYVTEADMEELPDEYRHEPSMALVAGKHGLSIISRILLEAHAYLNDGGGLLCEVGQCKPALERAFPHLFHSKAQKVQWFTTANSTEEVFYVKKEHLLPSDLRKVAK